MSRNAFASWACALVFVGCGGSVSPAGGSDGGSASGSGGSSSGSSSTSSGGTGSSSGGSGSGTSGSSGGTSTSSGSTSGSGSGAVPVNHRPSDSTCPAQRAGGMCTGPSEAGAVGCRNDCDCTAGKNGRCDPVGVGGPQPLPSCTYDECFDDSQCPAQLPCECRPSASSRDANFCLIGSTCRVDSDCGPGGYCSPSNYNEWCGTKYHCHTPQDTCVNASDCPAQQFCDFDTMAGRWACGPGCGPPPP